MIPYVKITEKEVFEKIKAATEEDVLASLASQSPGISDFLNLISPSALPRLADMASRASVIKKMHFGKTVKLYTPLYLSNYCINNCAYCGFNVTSKEPRKRLTVEEAFSEAEAIKSFGMDSILLVCGEDPNFITIDYLEELSSKLKNIFSYVAIEIYPLKQDGYERLFKAGVDGLTLYQETYDRGTYKRFHLSGPKADYDARIESLINGAKAGFRTLGIGALLGLYDWRIEAFSMAAHAIWLKKHFWQSKIQFSFPRITAANAEFHVPAPVTETELEQMVYAFRIVFPESEISISTRENCEFRNKTAVNAASVLSAASSVVPGGYSEKESEDLGQFSLHDTRSAEEMQKELKELGLDVVYKDWDSIFTGR